jgi:hypothetical protein
MHRVAIRECNLFTLQRKQRSGSLTELRIRRPPANPYRWLQKKYWHRQVMSTRKAEGHLRCDYASSVLLLSMPPNFRSKLLAELWVSLTRPSFLQGAALEGPVKLSVLFWRAGRSMTHAPLIPDSGFEIHAFLKMPKGGFNKDSEEASHAFLQHARREIPARFGVLAGEVVHHLRSILDHIIWLLSSEQYRRTNETQIAFPICVAEPRRMAERSRYDRKIGGDRFSGRPQAN